LPSNAASFSTSTPRSSVMPSGPYASTSITGFGAFGSTINVPGAVPGAGRGIRRLRRDFVLRVDLGSVADVAGVAACDVAGVAAGDVEDVVAGEVEEVAGADDGAGVPEGRVPPASDSGLVIASSSANIGCCQRTA
jgi:hypothetical protein